MTGDSAELARLRALGWLVPAPDERGVHHVARADGDPISYPDSGFDVLALDSGQGFWFDHRAAAIIDVVRASAVTSMWDIGAGTGSVAARVAADGVDVVAVEPMPAAALASADRGVTSVCGTLESLGLPDGCLPSVGLFDVVEHVAEPAALLAEVRRVLRPGGWAFVTVPAFTWLWGDEDDVAGHFRRYTTGSLVREMTHAGFRAVSARYLFASLVPVAAVARALPYRWGRRRSEEQVLEAMKDQMEPSPLVVRGAETVLSAERALARHLALPFGLSVLGVFRTPR